MNEAPIHVVAQTNDREWTLRLTPDVRRFIDELSRLPCGTIVSLMLPESSGNVTVGVRNEDGFAIWHPPLVKGDCGPAWATYGHIQRGPVVVFYADGQETEIPVSYLVSLGCIAMIVEHYGRTGLRWEGAVWMEE